MRITWWVIFPAVLAVVCAALAIQDVLERAWWLAAGATAGAVCAACSAWLGRGIGDRR